MFSMLIRNTYISIFPRQRHLFMTDEEVKIKLEELIRVCYVFPYSTIDDLDYWTALSADHFYVQYRFPSLSVSSWNDKQPINPDMYVCVDCCRDKLEQMKSMREFLAMGHRKPLPALDLFAGVGALGLGMEESGCIKVTHAIEIAPSAARTFKYGLSTSLSRPFISHRTGGTLRTQLCIIVVLTMSWSML